MAASRLTAIAGPSQAVALRLMTEADIPMLHEWLNRPHVFEWWGGDDGRPTLEEVRDGFLPRVLVSEGVTPYIGLLDGRPIGYAQSYTAFGRDDGWWADETDPGVHGIDQFIADPQILNRGVGTALARALVDRLFSDPAITKIQADPAPNNFRAIRCYEKAGFRKVRVIVTPDGPAVYMAQSRQAHGPR